MKKNQQELKPEKLTGTAEELASRIYTYLDDKKAEKILLLNLEKVNPYFQYFLIATASSQVHLRSLAKEILKNFGQFMPRGIGGFRPEDLTSGWVIVDFVDVVVHLFLDEQRQFYKLERLWGDARTASK